jgi:hypothetical protein
LRRVTRASRRFLELFTPSDTRRASLPAPVKKAPPTTEQLLEIGEARAACERFRNGQGGIAVDLADGRSIVVTAFLAPGEEEGAIRRGDRLRLAKIRRIGGAKFLVVTRQ